MIPVQYDNCLNDLELLHEVTIDLIAYTQAKDADRIRAILFHALARAEALALQQHRERGPRHVRC